MQIINYPMKYLNFTYIIQIKHCPIKGLSTNLWKIHMFRTRNLHPTHRCSLTRFVDGNAPNNVKQGVVGICGAFYFLSKFSIKCPTVWAINCDQYYINKRHLVKLPYLRAQNANQDLQGGHAIDYKPSNLCQVFI